MIGFGIAGTGWMADRMARAMMRSGAARIMRVASASDERARERQADWRAAAHGDFAALLDDPAVDAIYIAGHNRCHAAQSIAALDRGKAVLCEKPFALTLTEAESVVAAARRSGRLYMEAVATPFLPAVERALAIADSGRLGPVSRIEASFGYPADSRRQPALFEADGGVLADRAVYPLMLALLVLGPAADVDATVDRRNGIDVAANFTLNHRDGGISILAVSLVERLGNAMAIVCRDGVIDIAPPLLGARRLRIRRAMPVGDGQLRQNPILRRLLDQKARLTGNLHGYGASPYLGELRHFCALLHDGATESPVVSHGRMVEVARIIEEARRR